MYHIAIVEDEQFFSTQLQNYLKQYQEENDVEFKVSVFYDGKSILDNYTSDYDAVFLDIQMPGLNGFEVMEKLQENADWKKIPVIFLTADRSEATEEACFKVGAVDYIGKPFVPAIMQQRIICIRSNL